MSDTPDSRPDPRPHWREKLEEEAARARLAARRAIPQSRGAPRVSQVVMRALGPVLRQAGPAPDSLQGRWREIVGERIAEITTPIRVSPGRNGATLHLSAPSSAAPILQHAAEHILERVNIATGAKVTQLKIIHGKAAPKVKPAAPQATLSPLQRAELVRELSGLQSAPLRDAFASLGEAIRTRQKP